MSDEPMTDAELAELARLAEAAAPGPWDTLNTLDDCPMVYDNSNDAIVDLLPDRWAGTTFRPYFEPADAAFIAAARSAMPRLLAEVARLTAARDAAWDKIEHLSNQNAEVHGQSRAVSEALVGITRLMPFGELKAAKAALATANARGYTYRARALALLRQCEHWRLVARVWDNEIDLQGAASEARYAAALEHGEQAQRAAEAACDLLRKWLDWYTDELRGQDTPFKALIPATAALLAERAAR